MKASQQSPGFAGSHFLVTRTDRLGDMVLSLPLFAAIKHAIPQARLSVLASAANAEVARLCPHVDEVVVDTVEARDSKYKDILGLTRRLRAWRPDVMLFANAKHRLAVAAWLARVPRRVGSRRRRYSVLYTDPIPLLPEPPYEHEADRALRLLQPFGIVPQSNEPKLVLSEQQKARAGSLLTDLGITHDARIAVIHATNSGNALNAAPGWYAQLADALSAQGYKVVLTGTDSERAQIRAVMMASKSGPLDLTGRLSVAQLAGLYSHSTVSIASSTGTAHLSAAVGTPTIGLYSPLVKQSVWLPRGKRVAVLHPEVGMSCPSCLGEKCQYFNCMDLIATDAVLAAVRQIVDAVI